jgi:hypothetical protein
MASILLHPAHLFLAPQTSILSFGHPHGTRKISTVRPLGGAIFPSTASSYRCSSPRPATWPRPRLLHRARAAAGHARTPPSRAGCCTPRHCAGHGTAACRTGALGLPRQHGGPSRHARGRVSDFRY